MRPRTTCVCMNAQIITDDSRQAREMIALSLARQRASDAHRDRFASRVSSSAPERCRSPGTAQELRPVAPTRQDLRAGVGVPGRRSRLTSWTAICTVRRDELAMNASSIKRFSIAAVLLAGAAGTVAAGQGGARWFADRPVAWNEHDDADVPAAPAPNHLQTLETALTLRDSVANEADRILALEGRLPAEDVNAADEVPCSTWFCARNHLRPMSAEEIAAGPPVVAPRHAAHDHQGQGPRRRLRLPGQGRGGTKVHAEVRRRRPPRHGERRRDDRQPHLSRRRLQRSRRALDRSRRRRPEGRADTRPTCSIACRSGRSPPRTCARRCPGWRTCPTAACGRSSSPGSRETSWAGSTCWACGPTTRTTAFPTSTAGRCARAGCCSPGCRSSIRARSTRSTVTSRKAAGTSSATTSSTSAARSARRPTTRRACSRTASIWSRSGGRWRAVLARLLPAPVSGPARRVGSGSPPSIRRSATSPPRRFDPDTFRTNRKLPSHMRLTDRDAYWGAKLVTRSRTNRSRRWSRRRGCPTADARLHRSGPARPARHHRAPLPARGRRGGEPEPWRPTAAGSASRIWRSRAATRSRRRSATTSRRTTGSATASRATSRRRPDPRRASRSAAPTEAAAIASSQIRARFVGAGGTRRRPRRQGGARAPALARRLEPLRRRRTGEGRMTGGAALALLIAAAAAPRGVRGRSVRGVGRRTCPRSALRREAGRPGARRCIDRAPGRPAPRWPCRAWRRRPHSGRS